MTQGYEFRLQIHPRGERPGGSVKGKSAPPVPASGSLSLLGALTRTRPLPGGRFRTLPCNSVGSTISTPQAFSLTDEYLISQLLDAFKNIISIVWQQAQMSLLAELHKPSPSTSHRRGQSMLEAQHTHQAHKLFLSRPQSSGASRALASITSIYAPARPFALQQVSALPENYLRKPCRVARGSNLC